MKAGLALCLLALCHTAYARERLRVSEVTDSPAGEGVETLALEWNGKKETLHVKNEAIITEAHVRDARPDPGGSRAVAVQLNDEGAEKMARATARPGGRLAIIVDGVAVTAATVHSPFGASFHITVGQAKPGDLSRLAAAISGRPEESLPEPPLPPTPPALTDAEYKELRESREKAGIHYLHEPVSAQDLEKRLRKGMTPAEVTAAFGPAMSQFDDPTEKALTLIYSVAPEKRLPNPRREMVEDGFTVRFADGRVHSWGMSYTNSEREGKPPERKPSLLKVIEPPGGIPPADGDFVGYMEKIQIPDLNQHCTEQEVAQVASMIGMLELHQRGAEVKNPSIAADCDLIKFLALHLPVVADLRKSPEKGKIPLAKLAEKLHPYIFEGKPIPARPPAK